MSFAPGHLSLTFAICKDDNPLKMGSTGLGIVLPQGVHCAVTDDNFASSDNIVICGGSQIEDPVTLRALEILGFGDKGLMVYLRRDLPIGSGFGISAASALAACMEVEKDMSLATRAAHEAEIEFRTGLGDVMAISKSIQEHNFPAIAVREKPGYYGETKLHPLDDNFLICISGIGRETSDIIADKKWTEIINSSAQGIKISNVNLRSVIKAGRLFTEKTGLMIDSMSEALDLIPMGSVATVAHLGTSLIATSKNFEELISSLEDFGEIRKY